MQAFQLFSIILLFVRNEETTRGSCGARFQKKVWLDSEEVSDLYGKHQISLNLLRHCAIRLTGFQTPLHTVKLLEIRKILQQSRPKIFTKHKLNLGYLNSLYYIILNIKYYFQTIVTPLSTGITCPVVIADSSPAK